jgi:hypothetical protein
LNTKRKVGLGDDSLRSGSSWARVARSRSRSAARRRVGRSPALLNRVKFPDSSRIQASASGGRARAALPVNTVRKMRRASLRVRSSVA